MSIFKCKMCGGTLEVNNKETVGICEYCGTKQTLPKLDNERKSNLYDRANHFRRNGEFDKAMGIYEQILNEDNTDAESYWSIVLCRYGIEYVEDPTTHKRIPTVNRTQLTSIFDDEDYKSALQYADGYQREIYESEANTINEIQKSILAISQKEEPFDVFICYKETDEQGRRTQDSVLAQELYYELVEEGFKVFFARITLEDKLGQEYEPYIFAALNSAKVMVVVGTKPEHFNAVWVKNEWSRYLALIKKGENKMLIPAYRDMTPYDLPEEFSHLQAQDMEKLGFMQDLVRGISKLINVERPQIINKETVAVHNDSVVTSPLLQRAFMFLEDGDWDSATEYCERVLDMEPQNAMAYLGRLMVQTGARKREDLKHHFESFEHYVYYEKVIRFGDDALISELKGYLRHIYEREEEWKKDAIYRAAKAKMDSNTIEKYKEAICEFETISQWKDAKQKIEECRQGIETLEAIAQERKRIFKCNIRTLMNVLAIQSLFLVLCLVFDTIRVCLIIDESIGKVILEDIGVFLIPCFIVDFFPAILLLFVNVSESTRKKIVRITYVVDGVLFLFFIFIGIFAIVQAKTKEDIYFALSMLCVALICIVPIVMLILKGKGGKKTC